MLEGTVIELQNCRCITNIAEPYVWRLHLSADEFDSIDNAIRNSIQVHHGSHVHLITKENALFIITYLAEWYKREYQVNIKKEKAIDPSSLELKQLWELSGINIEKYVYKTDNGTNLWKYSIYVLGGLAIKHELNSNDNGKFLKSLCRIYHGEEYSLENLDEESRAVSFRQSIIQRHSLYEYLRDVLNGVYTDDDKLVQSLLLNIKSANDEVLKSKFRFEWIVTYSPYSSAMLRRLRVWLKPEETGGGLHQYLGLDRLLLWGVPEPETLDRLHFSIRWFNGTKVIMDINKDNPLISYSFAGKNVGFVTWGIDRFAVCKNVPMHPFTHFHIIAFDDEGHEYIAQQEDSTEWMQLWRTDPWKDEWSSRQSTQHQTSVIFNDSWSVDSAPDDRKPFENKKFGRSREWNFCYISSSITISNGRGKKIVLYNRIGYDQIYTKLHKDIIYYLDGGLVSYIIDDEEEGEIEERLPVIFGKDDLWLRYFVTKDAIADAKVKSDSMIEEVEYKMNNGHYTKWDKYNIPQYGINELRFNIRGVQHKLKTIYLPGPIVRDFNKCEILYKDISGEPRQYEDKIPLDKIPLVPYIPIHVGDAIINVIRPTLIKELYFDGELHAYNSNCSETTIPYLLKDKISIVDFSKSGYRKFNCSQISSVYPKLSSNDNSSLVCWEEGTKWPANSFDELAPSWLNICIGNNSSSDKTGLKFYKWNIYEETEPVEALYDEKEREIKGNIIFQEMRVPSESFMNICPILGHPNPFSKNKIGNIELKCFLVAQKYNIYFVAFSPLRKIGYGDSHKYNKFKDIIFAPLLNLRDGILTQTDKETIIRFMEEFSWDLNEMELELSLE